MGKGVINTHPYGKHANKGAAPSYGAALELRNLLPGLVAKVTHTRPCIRCGGATASSRKKICEACR